MGHMHEETIFIYEYVSSSFRLYLWDLAQPQYAMLPRVHRAHSLTRS